jgi:TPR repeat protein
MYAEGRGTAQNDAKAFEYFQLGAEAQHPAALFGLGKLYAEGRGVTRDDAKAREYYEYAANRGTGRRCTILACSVMKDGAARRITGWLTSGFHALKMARSCLKCARRR